MLKNMKRVRLAAVVTLLLDAATGSALAQNLSPNIRGDAGMKSGSMPPPGVYFVMPYTRSHYTSLQGPRGNPSPFFGSGNLHVLVGAVSVTTPLKILGADYGFTAAGIFNNQALTLATSEALTRDNSLGVGDAYFQPISLGWHLKRADITAGYGFFAPTGNGVRTADMWTNQYLLGGTVYFDEARHWHAAAMAAYTSSLKKRHSDIDVGDYLTIEGGVGRAFLKNAANVGLAYVVQIKTTNDSGSLPAVLPIALSRGYALGPEFNMPVFAKGRTFGIFGIRYVWEFANVYSFQGRTLSMSFTVGHMFKPLK